FQEVGHIIAKADHTVRRRLQDQIVILALIVALRTFAFAVTAAALALFGAGLGRFFCTFTAFFAARRAFALGLFLHGGGLCSLHCFGGNRLNRRIGDGHIAVFLLAAAARGAFAPVALLGPLGTATGAAATAVAV